MDKLVDTIVNNIQISIKSIHIRYEDKVTNPDHPFAFGVMLKGLSAETTNSKWQPMQVDGDATQVHKVCWFVFFSDWWMTLIFLMSVLPGIKSYRALLQNTNLLIWFSDNIFKKWLNCYQVYVYYFLAKNFSLTENLNSKCEPSNGE